LNGLKAIVFTSTSVARRITDLRGSEPSCSTQACFGPTLCSKDEPSGGLDGSGISKAAPDIRFQGGPAAGGGYVLRKMREVKV